LSDQIAEIIRNDVLTGRLRPAERVGQAQWADRVGVSRMPVRDAINQLCAEGILVQNENGFATVAKVDPVDVRDGYELTAIVASMAARRAAQRIRESEIAELEAIHAGMREAVESRDNARALRLNWAFHSAINRAARSPRLTAALRNLATSMPHGAAFELLPDWPEQARKDHEALLDALRRRDGERAAKLMREHIITGSTPVIEHLEQRLRNDRRTVRALAKSQPADVTAGDE